MYCRCLSLALRVTTSFSESGVRTFNIPDLEVTGGVVRGVLDRLTPGTTYMVTVEAVNGAVRGNGVGMPSDPAAVGNTESCKQLNDMSMS